MPVTPTELAELRAHLAAVVAMDNSSSCSASPSCSSYFIEPVEWMETMLLGHVEGKVLYRWKYWWELNLAVEPKITFARIMANFNLAVVI